MSEIHYNTQGSIARLFSQLKGQQVRLTIVAISIIIYIGLSIWNPMYSAIVIDHLWQSIQTAWQSGTPFSIDPIQYANLNTSYWQSHFYAYGRLP